MYYDNISLIITMMQKLRHVYKIKETDQRKGKT